MDYFRVHPTLGGDFEMPDGIAIYDGMAPMRPLPTFRDASLAETLGQGLTRPGLIGDQEIPWQVASPQSLPPLLLAASLQLIDGSPGKSGTSE